MHHQFSVNWLVDVAGTTLVTPTAAAATVTTTASAIATTAAATVAATGRIRRFITPIARPAGASV